MVRTMGSGLGRQKLSSLAELEAQKNKIWEVSPATRGTSDPITPDSSTPYPIPQYSIPPYLTTASPLHRASGDFVASMTAGHATVPHGEIRIASA